MNFPGIEDFQTRVDIIHYLKTLNWKNPAFHEVIERPHWFPPYRAYLSWRQRAAGKNIKHPPTGIP